MRHTTKTNTYDELRDLRVIFCNGSTFARTSTECVHILHEIHQQLLIVNSAGTTNSSILWSKINGGQGLWRKRNPFSQERLCLITSFISLWNLWITVITISNYLGISIKQKPQVWLIIITLHKPDRGKFSEIVVKGNSQTMRRSEINALQTNQPWILTYNSPVRSTVNILMSVVWIWIEREVLY